MTRPLERYREMRDFGATPEPRGHAIPKPRRLPSRGGVFVVQTHAATRLHYDFRLELDGVLLSWAVPKEPSVAIGARRLAVRTEDHPLEYAGFHGDIPEGHYGAGHVEIWDNGTWMPVGDAIVALAAGRLKFDLEGKRLRGRFVLVRMKSGDGERRDNWLLICERDHDAPPVEAGRSRIPRALHRGSRDEGKEMKPEPVASRTTRSRSNGDE